MTTLLADALLVLHFGIAAFIVSAFVLIPLGAWRGWRWVRRRALRLAHLGAIVFVALEALAGIACPLTLWEDALRGRGARGEGFIERWLGALLYWDLPTWSFTLAYTVLALLAALYWRWLPPAPSRQR